MNVSRRQALRITAAAGIALAFGGRLTYGLLERAGLRRRSETRIQMGTRVTVTVVHPDPDMARAMVEAAFAEIERLESLLSRHRPDTPVSRLGRDGIVGDAPLELVHLLSRASEVSELTRGAFDVTVAPLLDLYRAGAVGGQPAAAGESGGPSPRRGLPSGAEVEAALALVDYRDVRVEGSTVSLHRPGMAITLDGIAKGYVVDRTVATLVAGGAQQVLVEAGGDLAGSRPTDGDAWQVAIRHPRDAVGSLGVLQLRGEGVATSGDYMQAFTQDRSLHHILDPRTGRSPTHTSAVTVVAPSAMDADALSTAAFVLGPVEGIGLLEGLDGVEGLVVTKEGLEVETRGFVRRA